MTINVAYGGPFYIRKAAALPAWLQFPAEHPNTPAAVWEVIGIPNSQQTPVTTGAFAGLYGAQPIISINDPLGTNWPEIVSVSQMVLNFGNFPNKYGKFQPTGTYYGTGYSSFSGCAHDSGVYSGRRANILIGVGDSHWPDNSLRRFTYESDRPYWDTAIHGTNRLNWKQGFPSGDMNVGSQTLGINWTLPAGGGTFQWYLVYQMIDKSYYQWTGTTPTNGVWQKVPTINVGDALPAVGPVGSFLWQKGTTGDPASGWIMYHNVGGIWVNLDGAGNFTGAYGTFEVDQIDPVARTDDFRWNRHYDGSPRGGHSYTAYWCWEHEDLFVRRGGTTAYPIDKGSYDDMCAGNLRTQRWIGMADGDLPDAPMFPRQRDVGLREGLQPTSWTAKHPVTEDLWLVNDYRLVVLRRLPKPARYEIWFADAGQVSLGGGPFALCQPNVTNGPTSGVEFALGRRTDSWWWIYTTGSDKTRHAITSITGHPELITASATVDPASGGMLWIPDVQKMLYWQPSTAGGQPLLTIELTGLATIDVQPAPLVGAATLTRTNSGGGVHNNLHYSPRLKGFIYRIGDLAGTGVANVSMQFVRTG